MAFGHEYGPADDSDDGEEQQEPEPLPPDHPASVEQCDHGNCPRETPAIGQRVCEECTIIMHQDTPDTCEHCRSSIRD